MNLTRFEGGRRAMVGSALAGAAGLLLTGVGVVLQPTDALYSYLVAFSYWTGIAASALVLLCIFHASHAKWMVVLRRSLEAMALAVLPSAALFLPVALGMGRLYSWVDPPEGLSPEVRALLEHKRPYLNAPFFVARAAAYFALWGLVAQRLWRWSSAQDLSNGRPSEELLVKQRRLAAGALPFIAVALTFAAFDWLMSLEPTWFSTLFGVYYFAGSFVAAIAALTLSAIWGRGKGLPGELVGKSHLHSLGKLLFAFVSFWGYIAFSQYMLIWIANLPEEVSWFISRAKGAWQPVGVFLFVGHFAVPFVLLLSRELKRTPAFLAAMCVWILVVHYVDLFWVVIPALHPDTPGLSWTDATAFVGVGGLSVAFWLWRLRGAFAVPAGDPFLAQSLRYSPP